MGSACSPSGCESLGLASFAKSSPSLEHLRLCCSDSALTFLGTPSLLREPSLDLQAFCIVASQECRSAASSSCCNIAPQISTSLRRLKIILWAPGRSTYSFSFFVSSDFRFRYAHYNQARKNVENLVCFVEQKFEKLPKKSQKPRGP